eukprot:symbB.v1.2.030979.t1/scaffold3442.1/size104216/9
MRSLTFSVPVRKVARNFLPRLCLLPFHSKAVGGALVTRSSVMAHQHGGYPCPQFAPGRMISMPLVCCSGTDDRPRIAHSIPASPPLETKHAGNAMIRDQSPLVVCSPASPTLQARAIRGSNATIHDQYPAVICSPQSPQHQPRALRGNCTQIQNGQPVFAFQGRKTYQAWMRRSQTAPVQHTLGASDKAQVVDQRLGPASLCLPIGRAVSASNSKIETGVRHPVRPVHPVATRQVDHEQLSGLKQTSEAACVIIQPAGIKVVNSSGRLCQPQWPATAIAARECTSSCLQNIFGGSSSKLQTSDEPGEGVQDASGACRETPVLSSTPCTPVSDPQQNPQSQDEGSAAATSQKRTFSVFALPHLKHIWGSSKAGLLPSKARNSQEESHQVVMTPVLPAQAVGKCRLPVAPGGIWQSGLKVCYISRLVPVQHHSTALCLPSRICFILLAWWQLLAAQENYQCHKDSLGWAVVLILPHRLPIQRLPAMVG